MCHIKGSDYIDYVDPALYMLKVAFTVGPKGPWSSPENCEEWRKQNLIIYAAFAFLR